MLLKKLLYLLQNLDVESRVLRHDISKPVGGCNVRVGIIPRRDRNDDVNHLCVISSLFLFPGAARTAVARTYYKECPFKPVALTISQEVTNRQDGQDEQGNHEDLEV